MPREISDLEIEQLATFAEDIFRRTGNMLDDFVATGLLTEEEVATIGLADLLKRED